MLLIDKGSEHRFRNQPHHQVCRPLVLKDTWTKPKGVGSRVGGRDGWGGGGAW